MRVILSQITQITQRNAAGCIISQRKTVWVVIVVLGFVCDYLRNLRETLGFLLCGLIEYSHVNILPQIAQMTQTNAAKPHYFAEKDSLVIVVLGFVCVICEICGRHMGFLLCRLIEYSCVNILPQITQITQRNAASCIISQRKTV